LAGKVFAAGQRVEKPGALVSAEAPLSVVGPDHPFVSRGGVKLRHALDAFRVDPRDRVCLDVGASTGGFTDCLLQAGARLVIAVDVGYGQIHARLRQDARVHILERTNVRPLEASRLPAVPDLATIDVSFISLALVLPTVRRLLAERFDLIALVKPQFEVGKGQVGKRGVVRDAALHRAVLERVAASAADLGCGVAGMTILAARPHGNCEFPPSRPDGGGDRPPDHNVWPEQRTTRTRQCPCVAGIALAEQTRGRSGAPGADHLAGNGSETCC
jgi:23S rRNA (cytidine1920-2'-O)/16S rRNA (cytidine1409-2'-O)-methyltransferase